MSTAYQVKTFNLKALDVDTATKRVKVAIGETESIDHDGDLIVPTAAIRTIKARGPEGSNEIWHLTDHHASLKSALGKFSEMGMDGKYIYGISQYKDTSLWRDTVWPLYESGDITQHSIGFKTIKEQQKDGYNEIQEIKLFEGSAVLWGANSNTPMLEIYKSLTKEKKIEEVSKRWETVLKAISAGRYEDDNSLLVIELKQLQQLFIDLTKNSTDPAKEATHPDKKNDLSIADLKKAFSQAVTETFTN